MTDPNLCPDVHLDDELVEDIRAGLPTPPGDPLVEQLVAWRDECR